jgi:hypothetical protein
MHSSPLIIAETKNLGFYTLVTTFPVISEYISFVRSKKGLLTFKSYCPESDNDAITLVSYGPNGHMPIYG